MDIVHTAGLEGCKPCKFSFPKGIRLSTDEGEVLTDPETYRSIIGRLLYLNLTRPDISYFVQQLSQFMACPRKPHLQAAFHVIKYLAGTITGAYFIRLILTHHFQLIVMQIGELVPSVGDP